MLMSNVLDWDPSVLDHDIDGDKQRHDAMLDEDDPTNELFDVFGNHTGRRTDVASTEAWHNMITPGD
jgi:hypothetical protein